MSCEHHIEPHECAVTHCVDCACAAIRRAAESAAKQIFDEWVNGAISIDATIIERHVRRELELPDL